MIRTLCNFPFKNLQIIFFPWGRRCWRRKTVHLVLSRGANKSFESLILMGPASCALFLALEATLDIDSRDSRRAENHMNNFLRHGFSRVTICQRPGLCHPHGLSARLGNHPRRGILTCPQPLRTFSLQDIFTLYRFSFLVAF